MSDMSFADYYRQWVDTYKRGAVRPITLRKYETAETHIREILGDTPVGGVTRTTYQMLMNKYAETHEHQTVIDFHHLVKASVLDAVDEGMIERDPTRRVVLKGCQPRDKHQKYLSQYELHSLLGDLNLSGKPADNWDWLILLIAKTGLRFAEALGITPSDFDMARQSLNVTKTWDYKSGSGFAKTKNNSSVRMVSVDWYTMSQFAGVTKAISGSDPIFIPRNDDGSFAMVYNSTANHVLERHCRRVGIPTITIHGLRHTHASLMLYAGASVLSVSKRLGHSSITTTQKVYLHVINEMENQDTDLMMRTLAAI